MRQDQVEVVGKVFEVVGEKRRCLICDGVFTPKQAAKHAATVCYPTSADSQRNDGTLDPCSPFLPLTDCSSSPGQA